jgi:hypothetical protein
MSQILERLVDVDVRAAFAHEARSFTPWLAANLDRLADALGFNLELVQTEAAVENFSADIVAHCPDDGQTVLIENQLGGSDHTHLGQILTYVAGIEAHCVVWVATGFRDEHLSAIRWLNRHTPREFTFFAVRLRVVRIGSSPLAPLFEIVEEPNEWERELTEQVRIAEASSEIFDAKEKFWKRYGQRYPDSLADRGGGRGSNRWRTAMNGKVWISYYLATSGNFRGVGLFIRSAKGITDRAFRRALDPHRQSLANALAVEADRLADHLNCDYADEKQFDHIADWLHRRVAEFEAALNQLTDGKS